MILKKLNKTVLNSVNSKISLPNSAKSSLCVQLHNFGVGRLWKCNFRTFCSLFASVIIFGFFIFYYQTQTYRRNSRIVPIPVSYEDMNLTKKSTLLNLMNLYENKRIPNIQTFNSTIEVSCELPNLDPFDESIIEFIHLPDQINCEKNNVKLFRTNSNSKLIPIKQMEDQSCCYKTMERKIGSDTSIKMSIDCHPLKSNEETKIPSSHEFISIICNFTDSSKKENKNNSKFVKVIKRVVDMFAFVPLKPKLQKRLKNFTNKKKYPGNIENEQLNVLILGLDAQSRMNFLRQMPLSYDFIMKNLSAIEFKGYTKVGDNTFPNLVPILTGLNVSELQKLCWNANKVYFDKCPFIWNHFRENGYITSYGEDSVWMGMFTYEKRGFWKQPTDYYLNPFMHQMSKRIGHEPVGNVKLCYGPRLGFEVLLDYITKTSIQFQKDLYFQFIWASSLFHDYLNYPKHGDKILAKTLKFLQSHNLFNQTVLILLSDHGIRWGGIRNTVQGKFEERMPMNFWIFPPWFHKKYSSAMNNFKKNTWKLTTPFDVHETLKNLLTMKLINQEVFQTTSPSRGISFFKHIPTNRTCESAAIEEHWCVCNGIEKILDTNLTIVQTGAKFIISKLNFLLRNQLQQCANLKLYKIINVSRKKVNNTNELHLNQTILQVTLMTIPGDAIFEATISISGSQHRLRYNLVGEISRLNLYETQSWCVSDFVLKKYCFCIIRSPDNNGLRLRIGHSST